MPKIAIVGAGAVGGSIAAILSEKGYDVTVMDKNQKHVEAITQSGLLIDGMIETKTYKKIIIHTTLTGIYDIIFLAVKSTVTKNAVQEIKVNLAPDGVLVSLQNGINNDLIIPEVGETRFIAGVVGFGATNQGPGHISITSAERIFSIGTVHSANSRLLPAAANILAEVGEVHISENIFAEQWGKLAMNCVINPFCAIHNRTFGENIRHTQTRLEMQKVLTEVIVVGRAAGVTFNKIGGKINLEKVFLIHVLKNTMHLANHVPSLLEKILAFLAYPVDLAKGALVLKVIGRYHGNIMSSMWQDLHMNQKTEIDFLNGYVAKLGRRYRLTTEANDRVVAAITGLEQARSIC